MKLYIKTIVGSMIIFLDADFNIITADFTDPIPNKKYTTDDISIKIGTEINEYLAGNASELKSKYKLSGTEFQLKVWKVISQIPYGQTMTYSEVAHKIKHPSSCRAVANACGQNNLVLYIPCHRVVGKNNLGGYSSGCSDGPDIKKWILNRENKFASKYCH